MPRIDIDESLLRQLDSVKEKEYIGGKGHRETIAFLVRFYHTHRSIEELQEQFLKDIRTTLSKSILRDILEAFKRAFFNISGD
ncbi:MAG: hypothetical protein ACP6IU_13035 [Candidatus Asgardarchaeia archaeon]